MLKANPMCGLKKKEALYDIYVEFSREGFLSLRHSSKFNGLAIICLALLFFMKQKLFLHFLKKGPLVKEFIQR